VQFAAVDVGCLREVLSSVRLYVFSAIQKFMLFVLLRVLVVLCRPGISVVRVIWKG